MEKYNLVKIFRNKKVLITGHTGFNVLCLSLWLNISGAKVYGISNNYKSTETNIKNFRLKKNVKNFNIEFEDMIKLEYFSFAIIAIKVVVRINKYFF